MTISSNKPSHRVYAVVKRNGDASVWDEIGAAWSHKDGKGFNLKLNYLPLNAADIVIREPKPKDAAGAPEAPAPEFEGGF